MPTIYDIEVTKISGEKQRLDTYRGNVLLIVNVASKCGFTPQYEGLESLQRKYQEQGFAVLGFPCDQFGHQEPGNEAEIREFCKLKYDVTFPLYAKIDVNGAHEHPLYRFLKSAARGVLWTKRIKWNFTKFLIDRKGNVVKRYAPLVTPEKLDKDLERLL